MAQQKPQEKKLVIELRHPEEELRVLWYALEALSQPGLPREEILRLRRVIKAAKASQRLIHAYIRYLKFRVAFLEQQLSEAAMPERS
jgi:hypothetical protein